MFICVRDCVLVYSVWLFECLLVVLIGCVHMREYICVFVGALCDCVRICLSACVVVGVLSWLCARLPFCLCGAYV